VRRADVEGFARDLEACGRARATVTRRLCTIAGFCKYAVEEELPEHFHVPTTHDGQDANTMARRAWMDSRWWW
jgi:hypothetical protein